MKVQTEREALYQYILLQFQVATLLYQIAAFEIGSEAASSAVTARHRERRHTDKTTEGSYRNGSQTASIESGGSSKCRVETRFRPWQRTGPPRKSLGVVKGETSFTAAEARQGVIQDLKGR